MPEITEADKVLAQGIFNLPVLAGDHIDKLAGPLAAHRELGAEQEREAIVAWLRKDAGGMGAPYYARLIAAGAHRG